MILLTALLLTCGIFFLKQTNKPLVSIVIRLLKINEVN